MERILIFERLLEDFRTTVGFLERSDLRRYEELGEIVADLRETHRAARAEVEAMRAEAEAEAAEHAVEVWAEAPGTPVRRDRGASATEL